VDGAKLLLQLCRVCLGPPPVTFAQTRVEIRLRRVRRKHTQQLVRVRQDDVDGVGVARGEIRDVQTDLPR
jgi:hypothetical protein